VTTLVPYGAVFLTAKIMLQKLLQAFEFILNAGQKPHIFYGELLNCYANLERDHLYVLLLKRKMFRMKNVEENMSGVVCRVIFLSVFLFSRQLK